MRVVMPGNNGRGRGWWYYIIKLHTNCLLPYMDHNGEERPVSQPAGWLHQHQCSLMTYSYQLWLVLLAAGVVSYQWQAGWWMVMPGVEVTILGWLVHNTEPLTAPIPGRRCWTKHSPVPATLGLGRRLISVPDQTRPDQSRLDLHLTITISLISLITLISVH